MPTTLLQKIDKERIEQTATAAVEAAKMCRISLAKSAARPIELDWCQGRGFRKSLIILRPGESVTQPLDKCHAWFGPFDLFRVYEETRDEKTLDGLRELISTESARYLSRYDYERDPRNRFSEPIGPHRSPDVTITVLNSDGTEDAPVRLHEVYGIGEYDDLKDSFRPKESEEEIRARFEAQLREKDELHRAEIEQFKRSQAEIAGMVKGFIQAKNQEPAPAAQAV